MSESCKSCGELYNKCATLQARIKQLGISLVQGRIATLDRDECISDAITLMADYDGYSTVDGLKKLIDQTTELLQTEKAMEFHTEKEWQDIAIIKQALKQTPTGEE